MFDFTYFASLSVEAKAFFRLKAQLLVIKIQRGGFSRIYARKLNSLIKRAGYVPPEGSTPNLKEEIEPSAGSPPEGSKSCEGRVVTT
jgi:hypothetical protein